MDGENILRAVHGIYLGSASKALPDPATASSDTAEVTITTPEHGQVIVTFRRLKYARGRNRFFSWVPAHARKCEARERPQDRAAPTS